MLRFAAKTVAAAIVCVMAGPAMSADDTTLKVKVGDKFPDVPLAAAQIDKVKKDAKTVSIADLKGKTVVVFFYPKALTPGCTVESCGFRDLVKENKLPENVVLLGVSGDTVAKQQEFIDKEKLPMPLLADTDLKLIKELGILGKAGGTTPKRITFVVDKDGKIAKIYEKVAPKDHPQEVLEFVKSLK
ncbi:peroxiredoxin [Gemmata sp. G18]|uniref:thioredoxin-dependent peroxiredoxin n=1 Tax=Gemmata palustris TaxID=2822762 RepID=A0ABS5BYW8_9BACT|nr:peroxiredoxin [Gemmata palustris]MBP3958860.1 peroxiredoxin [Gemmata palustris]